jgi:hypothetical protein
MKKVSLLVGGLIALVACTSSAVVESPPTPPTVTSFHYVVTTSFEFEGQKIGSRDDGYYRSPDSFRVVSNSAHPYLETVLIGSQAWKRDASGWLSTTPDSIRPLVSHNVDLILKLPGQLDSLQDGGPGPTVAGEDTHLYRPRAIPISNYKPELALPCTTKSEADAVDQLDQIHPEYEFLVSQRTGLLVSWTATFSGPFAGKATFSVDSYNQEVPIVPPSSASIPPPRASQQIICPG